MRFNSEAYAKAFPRREPTAPIETVVETFRPTTEPVKENTTPELEEETDGGDGGNSEPDPE